MTNKTLTADLGLPDDGISLTDLAKQLDLNLSTCWRWTMTGVTGADGRVHVLPSFRIGRRTHVSLAEFRAWHAKVNAKPGSAKKPTRTKRDAEMAAAAKAKLASR